MTLPEIPDEAVRAVVASFMDPEHTQADAEWSWVREDLAVAWPHLYAAALRHAMENPGIDVACHDLLRCMAEAATA